MPTDAVKRFRHVLGVTVSRAGFIAGFTYYEAGRNDFAPHIDEAYTWFTLLAFVLSVVSVAVSGFGLYYLGRLDDGHKDAFATRAKAMYRASWQTFVLSVWCWLMALARVGFVYYDAHYQRWIPFVVFTTTFVITVFAAYFVGSSIADCWALPEDVPIPKPPFNVGKPISEYILMQCDGVGNTAALIAGFAVVTVVRYIPTDDPLGDVYLVLASLTCGSSVVATVLLTYINVFLFDLFGNRREVAAQRLIRFWRMFSMASLVSSLCLYLTVVFMGHGTDAVNKVPYVLYGCLGFVAYVALFVKTGGLYRHFQLAADARLAKEGAAAIEVPAPASDDVEYRSPCERVMAALSPIKGQASILSGFTLYTMATSATDLRPLDTDSLAKNMFVGSSVIAFVFGLLSFHVGSFFTTYTAALSKADSERFAETVQFLPRVASVFYTIGLVTFMNSFAFIGPAKFDAHTDITTVSCFIAYGFLVVACVLLAYTVWAAKRDVAASPAGTLPADTASRDDANPDVFTSKLSGLASASMFPASFAYFATLFFFGFERPTAEPYLVTASISVVIGFLQVTWATIVGTVVGWQPSQRLRRVLAYRMRIQPRIAYSGFLVCVTAFGLSFSLVGFIKTVDDYTLFAPVILWGAAAGILPTLLVVGVLGHLGRSSLVSVQTPNLEGSNVERTLSRAAVVSGTSAFSAGNVFFEVLFTVTNVNNKPATFAYYATSTLAFVLGFFCVVVLSVFVARVGRISSKMRRKEFVVRSRSVLRVVSTCHLLSLFAWMASLMPFGWTKYSTKSLRPAPCVCGVVGILLAAAMFVKAASVFSAVSQLPLEAVYQKTPPRKKSLAPMPDGSRLNPLFNHDERRESFHEV